MANPMTELCPFCGFAATPMTPTHDRSRWWVVCNNDGTLGDDVEMCGAQGPERPNEAEAIAAWNTRTATPEPPVSEPTKRMAEIMGCEFVPKTTVSVEASTRTPEAAQVEMLVEALTKGRFALTEMLRLSDMGLEESLREPEEAGNFAAYNRAKEAVTELDAALAQVRASEQGGAP